MNPIVVLMISGVLALLALLLAIVRFREIQKMRAATKELESLDQAFSNRLTSIEGIVGQLGESASAPSDAPRHLVAESPDPHQGRWGYLLAKGDTRWPPRYREHTYYGLSGRVLRYRFRARHATTRRAEAEWRREEMALLPGRR